MRRRGRRTIGIHGEELVGVLYGVGGRMSMMVQPVVLSPLKILLKVVELALHREERRGPGSTPHACVFMKDHSIPKKLRRNRKQW